MKRNLWTCIKRFFFRISKKYKGYKIEVRCKACGNTYYTIVKKGRLTLAFIVVVEIVNRLDLTQPPQEASQWQF